MQDLKHSPFIRNFPDILKQHSSLLFEELFDSAKAAILGVIHRDMQQPLLIITGHEGHTQLANDLQFFTKTEPMIFPAWEALPGEEVVPSADVMGMRMDMLHALIDPKSPPILVTSLQSAMQKVLSSTSIQRLSRRLIVGRETSFEELTPFLTSLGYRRARIAVDKGEFAVRGGIIDVFPIHLPEPVRIEFFADTIEEIRTYDPMSQRSTGKRNHIDLSYADESTQLKQEKAVSLFEYFSRNAVVVFDDLLALENRLVQLRSLPSFRSSQLFDGEEFFTQACTFQHIFFAKEPISSLSSVQKTQEALEFSMFDRMFTSRLVFHPFQTISQYFDLEQGNVENMQQALLTAMRHVPHRANVYFLSSSDKEEESFKEKLYPISHKLPTETQFVSGYLSTGFVLTDADIFVVPYTEWTRRLRLTRKKWRNTFHTPSSDFHEMAPGDLVVHFHNGIGKFLGMEKQKNHTGVIAEFLVIEYAEKSKLFVPISQSHLVSRYIGAHQQMPTLHQLGSTKWQKTKESVQQAIVGYAKDLLTIQAQREVEGGFSYPEESELFQQFCEAFPYEETEDQLRAIADILKDMYAAAAMDRLVCGDVGYGKTEVAMRAAFKAAVDGKKQVAVLVPTTVLAVQHYETFSERMQMFPVKVGVVSRFQSAKEIKETLARVKMGEIDILIGTHRLISKDVEFRDLGLIIIDEEQRFGVRAKEKLKMVKTGVDCITLTATPIPRTLYMSLIHLREMSVINSPPHDRLPIKTVLAEKDPSLMKNAILREVSRDGQVYFIHNRIETIHRQAEDIQTLMPSAKVAVVHGQMEADTIDKIFHAFKRGDIDILVTTSIVENGIDIPNANTIIIDRADRFGVADLYQLRGRVGRWNKTAYAYFLIEKNRMVSEITKKRLQALVDTSGFGGGVKLAMLDLEIRGAGDILGTQQSGQVAVIGFHLYCKLLKKTIDALKKKKPTSFLETRMEFPFDAKIPDTYIHEPAIRLEIYHRLGDADDIQEVDSIMDELQDRFGPVPSSVTWLYYMTRIRIFAHTNQFTQLKFLQHAVVAEQKHKKGPITKKFLLPPFETPQELEWLTLKKLCEHFEIKAPTPLL